MTIAEQLKRRHVESIAWKAWDAPMRQLPFPWTEEQAQIIQCGLTRLTNELYSHTTTTDEEYLTDAIIRFEEGTDQPAMVARIWNEMVWPALSLLPWLDRVDTAMVVSIAPEGERCMPFHVVTTTSVVRSRLLSTGDVMQIADNDNPHGAMDWIQLANMTKRGRPEHEQKTQEMLNAAMAWEIHSITKKNLQ